MYTVYNWQLKRSMAYKYQEVRPERQVAWVFDTNKCIACQTCTMACKTTWTSGKGQEYMFWNNVETKPWGFYPLGWDVRLLEMLGPQRWERDQYKGMTIFKNAPYSEEILGWLPEEEDYQFRPLCLGMEPVWDSALSLDARFHRADALSSDADRYNWPFICLGFRYEIFSADVPYP